MKFQNFIAYRYLKSRKQNRILSFISAISIIGITLGVATLIVVTSVMAGFESNLKEKILGANSHVVVNRLDGKPITQYGAVEMAIKSKKGVEGVSPFIINQVLLTSRKNVSGVVIRGVLPEKEMQVTDIKKYMKLGKFTDLNVKEGKTHKIMLGEDLANSLGVTVGDKIVIVSPFGKRGPMGFTPKMRNFVVGGIFDTGMYEYNTSLAYISLEAAQEFFGTGKIATGFSLKVSDFDRVKEITAALNEELTFPYYARDWISMNKSLFSALQLEKITMFIILTLIVIVASFNVVSMISVSVKDKKRDIAILRAMGTSEWKISGIFMRQGMALGLLGTVIGNILGFVICWVLENYKIIELNEDVYYLDRIPVIIQPEVYVLVTVCALAITFVAGLFPAWQSAKLDPIEALRRD